MDKDLDSNQLDMVELEALMGRRDTTGRVDEDEVKRGGEEMFEGSLRIGDGGLFGGIQGGSGGLSIFGGLGGDKGVKNTFMRSFGTSVVEQSTRLPSGGVETSRTVRFGTKITAGV